MKPQAYLVAGRLLRLSNLEKELWPGQHTKLDLIHYFLLVADAMLPYLAGRPASFTRWPGGIGGTMFFQKNKPAGAPSWLPTHTHGQTRYLLVEEPATLVFLANLAVIEVHTMLARVPDLTHPDLAVIDLDPTPPCGFEEARRVAQLTKVALDNLGLVGFPKTSGATGVHIYLPLDGSLPREEVLQHIRHLGLALRSASPHLVTLERLKRKRQGVYFDYGQNGAGRTMVAPYSPRPLPAAPVSTPISWQELDHCQPEDFTIRTVPERVRSDTDPWREMSRCPQDLRPLQRL